MKYEELSVAQLREIAKEKNIAKVSAMKKQELIEALTALEKLSAQASEEKKNVKTGTKKQQKTETGEVKQMTGEKKTAAKAVKPAAEIKTAEKEAKQQAAEKAETEPKQPAAEKAETEPKQPAAEKTEKKAKQPAAEKTEKKAKQPAKRNVKQSAEVKTENTSDERQAKNETAKEEKAVSGKASDIKPEKPAEIKAEKPVKESGKAANLEELEVKKRAAAEIMAAAEVREAAQRFEKKTRPDAAVQQNALQNRQMVNSVKSDYDRQNGPQKTYQSGSQGQQKVYQSGSQGQQKGYQASGQGQQRNYQNMVQGQQRPLQQGRPLNNMAGQDNFVQPRENVVQNSYQAKDPSVVANENMQNEQQQEANRKPLIPDFDYDARSIMTPEIVQLDSGVTKEGILEIMNDGYGFIRCDNFLPGEHDVYVSPAQIRKLNLKTGDIISGNTKIKGPTEKFSALLYVKTVNGRHPSEAHRRPKFEDLTPIFPHDRIHLETPGCTSAMRIVDMLSPIGKGQRGMIVSQPKAGKTTLLKQIAKAITTNYPDMHLIILLIDERPEEVTDMKESIEGKNVEVIYSTFDELPENHKRVSEMVIERAKRLVEHKMDVCVLLDSITRLARAYNLTCAPSGRTLSGGLDPAALHMPKKFFGAARCMREGGSLTILATALVDTGSRMDDVVFEEFKGTGNMELVLDRNLSEKRIFPAIDLPRSSTRRDDLLLSQQELEVNEILRHAFSSARSDQMIEKIINLFANTKTNREFCETVKKTKLN